MIPEWPGWNLAMRPPPNAVPHWIDAISVGQQLAQTVWWEQGTILSWSKWTQGQQISLQLNGTLLWSIHLKVHVCSDEARCQWQGCSWMNVWQGDTFISVHTVGYVWTLQSLSGYFSISSQTGTSSENHFLPKHQGHPARKWKFTVVPFLSTGIPFPTSQRIP